MDLPTIDDDVFSREAVLNARAVDDRIRELAPVVWLAKENIALIARWEHVSEGLREWETFSNTSRPWHDPNSVRPEILLTDDPPRHTQVRAIIAEGHVRLAETLAERIAAACFEDARVRTVRVRVEKLEALTAAESVGIEIERTR